MKLKREKERMIKRDRKKISLCTSLRSVKKRVNMYTHTYTHTYNTIFNIFLFSSQIIPYHKYYIFFGFVGYWRFGVCVCMSVYVYECMYVCLLTEFRKIIWVSVSKIIYIFFHLTIFDNDKMAESRVASKRKQKIQFEEEQ